MSLSRKITAGSQEDLKMAGDLQGVRGWGWRKGSCLLAGVGWLELAAVLKEGVPGHSYQLARMWGRRGMGVMGFEDCPCQK